MITDYSQSNDINDVGITDNFNFPTHNYTMSLNDLWDMGLRQCDYATLPDYPNMNEILKAFMNEQRPFMWTICEILDIWTVADLVDKAPYDMRPNTTVWIIAKHPALGLKIAPYKEHVHTFGLNPKTNGKTSNHTKATATFNHLCQLYDEWHAEIKGLTLWMLLNDYNDYIAHAPADRRKISAYKDRRKRALKGRVAMANYKPKTVLTMAEKIAQIENSIRRY